MLWAFLVRNLEYFLQYFKLSETFKQITGVVNTRVLYLPGDYENKSNPNKSWGGVGEPTQEMNAASIEPAVRLKSHLKSRKGKAQLSALLHSARINQQCLK